MQVTRTRNIVAYCLILCSLASTLIADELDESSPKRLAVSKDGGKVAAATNDSKIHVWEIGSGKILHSLAVDQLGTSVAFSPDGRILVAGTHGTRVDASQPTRSHLYAWDLSKSEATLLWKTPVVGSTMALAVEPRGEWCAAITVYATMGIYHIRDGTMRSNWTERGNSPHDLAISNDGNTIATAGQAYILWSTKENSQYANSADLEKALDADASSQFVRARTGGAIATAISADDKWAIAVGQYVNRKGLATDVVVIDLENAKVLSNVADSVNDVSCISLSPDGKIVAMGFNTSRIKLLDIEHKTWIADWQLEDFGRVRSLSFVEDGNSLAIASENGGNVLIVDADTGARKKTLWPK